MLEIVLDIIDRVPILPRMSNFSYQSSMQIHLIQYMPNKPDKFGIKFWIAADVKAKYMLHSFPYMGKDDSQPADITSGEQVVVRLTKPYRKTV